MKVLSLGSLEPGPESPCQGRDWASLLLTGLVCVVLGLGIGVQWALDHDPYFERLRRSSESVHHPRGVTQTQPLAKALPEPSRWQDDLQRKALQGAPGAVLAILPGQQGSLGLLWLVSAHD